MITKELSNRRRLWPRFLQLDDREGAIPVCVFFHASVFVSARCLNPADYVVGINHNVEEQHKFVKVTFTTFAHSW